MFKNSRKQGDAGLGKAISHFTKLGLTVAIPLTDSQDYDLIVEIDGELKKVQVKTGTGYHRKKNGKIPVVHAVIKGGNRSGTGKTKGIQDQDWDLIYCWHIPEDIIYLIPKSDLTTNGQINIGKKYERFKVG